MENIRHIDGFFSINLILYVFHLCFSVVAHNTSIQTTLKPRLNNNINFNSMQPQANNEKPNSETSKNKTFIKNLVKTENQPSHYWKNIFINCSPDHNHRKEISTEYERQKSPNMNVIKRYPPWQKKPPRQPTVTTVQSWIKWRKNRISRGVSGKLSETQTLMNKAVIVGEDLSVPCLMNDPIAWLKGDYIIFMDNIMMYSNTQFGENKFDLDVNPSRTRYSLVIRSVTFLDSGSYYCQTGRGLKTKVYVTVIEPPACYDRDTSLDEGEISSFSCVVRVKGENSRATNILWNKDKIKKTLRTNSSDFTIVSSELEYRAKFSDNTASLACYVSNPYWNRTLPAPNCSLGILDIKFEPRLLCDSLQSFPDEPRADYYVFCDIVANPIGDLDSILWNFMYHGMKRTIEEFENMTRNDISIANGFRSRITVPYKVLKSNGGFLDFTVKMVYDGTETEKIIRLAVLYQLPSMFVLMGATLASVLMITMCILFLCYRLAIAGRGQYDVAPQAENNIVANGNCVRSNLRNPSREINPSAEQENQQENQLEFAPELKNNEKPNNRDIKIVDKRTRRVRFTMNI